MVTEQICDLAALLFWLFELDRWSERPNPINQLVISIPHTYTVKFRLYSSNCSCDKHPPKPFYLKGVNQIIKKVSVNQHAKSVSLPLLFLLLLCLLFVAASFTSVKSGFSFVLPKQKFVVLCWAENLLMQNKGLLHKRNFSTTQPPLWSVFH